VGTPIARLSAASDVTDTLTPSGVHLGESVLDLSDFPTPFNGPASEAPAHALRAARPLGFDLPVDLAHIAGRVHLARAAAAFDGVDGPPSGQAGLDHARDG
jgi:hypothetical protein